MSEYQVIFFHGCIIERFMMCIVSHLILFYLFIFLGGVKYQRNNIIMYHYCKLKYIQILYTVIYIGYISSINILLLVFFSLPKCIAVRQVIYTVLNFPDLF